MAGNRINLITTRQNALKLLDEVANKLEQSDINGTLRASANEAKSMGYYSVAEAIDDIRTVRTWLVENGVDRRGGGQRHNSLTWKQSAMRPGKIKSGLICFFVE